MKYLYDGRGDVVAVLESNFIFNMDGYAVGFLEGVQVFKITGEWVGQLHEDMVVDTFTSSPGSQLPPVKPGRIPPPDRVPGRGRFDYGYPCRIEKLLE